MKHFSKKRVISTLPPPIFIQMGSAERFKSLMLSVNQRTFINLFIFLLMSFIFLRPYELAAQSNCENATEISIGASPTQIVFVGAQMWLKFQATSNSIFLMINNPINQEELFSQLDLFDGSCNNLSLLITNFNIADTLFLSHSGMTENEWYFLRLSNSSDISGTFTIVAEPGIETLAYTLNNCQNHDCNLVRNGSFEQVIPYMVNYFKPFSSIFMGPSSVCGWYDINTPQVYNQIPANSGNNYAYCWSINPLAEMIVSPVSITAGDILNIQLYYQLFYNQPLGYQKNRHIAIRFLNFNPGSFIPGHDLSSISSHPGVIIEEMDDISYWKKGSATFTAPSNFNAMVIYAYTDQGLGILHTYLDDISISKSCDPIPRPGSQAHTFNDAKSSDLISYFNLNINNPILTTNDAISFNGTLLIENDFTFDQCPLLNFGPYATIELKNNTQLNILNSNLKACGEECMWQGIVVDHPSEKVYISQSIITDAISGIYTSNNGEIEALKSSFNFNHTGIRASNNISGPGTSTSYNVSIKETSFVGTTITRWPYIGQKSQYGINVINAKGFTVGSISPGGGETPNYFNGLYCGIKSHNSELAVYHSKFTSIQPPTTYPLPAPMPASPVNHLLVNQETAIHSTFGYSSVTNSPTPFLTVGANANNRCQFNFCSNGIYTFNMNINAKYNLFTNTSKGIRCLEVPNNLSYTHVDIIGNEFAKGTIAIDIDNFFLRRLLFKIENNTITNYNTGIFIKSVASFPMASLNNVLPRIYMNTINFNKDNIAVTGIKYGIRAHNCRYMQILGNTITNYGTMPTTGWDAKYFRGIECATFQYGLVKNNNLTAISRGIRLAYMQNNTQFRCNKFTDCHYGFYFDTQSRISNQGSATDNTHNEWIGNYGIYGENKMVKSFDANLQYQPKTDWWYYSGAPTYNPSILNGHDLYNYINQIGNSSNSNNCSTYSLYYQTVIDPETREEEIGLIINDSIEYTWYEEQSFYLDQMYAYNRMLDDPGLVTLNVDADSLYEAFYNEMEESNIGMLARIQQLIDDGLLDTAIVLNDMLQDENQMEANSQFAYQMYLNYYANDNTNMTQEEFNELLGIASEVPYLGGMSVYTARAMLLVDPDIYGLPYRHAQPESNTTMDLLKIYPNPSNGELIIDLAIPFGEDGWVEVFNLTGQMVLKSRVEANATQHRLVLDIPDGLYLIKVQSGKTNVYSGKLIIQK